MLALPREMVVVTPVIAMTPKLPFSVDSTRDSDNTWATILGRDNTRLLSVLALQVGV